MKSENHLVGGIALASVAGDAAYAIPVEIPVLSDAVAWSVDRAAVGVACAFSLYLLGCLLPDVDISSSWLGRFVCVFGGHRTWTHALWVPMALVAWWVFDPRRAWVLWLVFGYVAHLILDSWSAMGICWFWPYPGYRVYGRGARVKKSKLHKAFSFYHTGTDEEQRVVTLLVLAAATCKMVRLAFAMGLLSP
jgi:membrane-bound metal-dependent hydrolase YbcI (DUF457 family)